MENILKELNGKQLGNQYCFSRNNEKFVATWGYSSVIDYGWKDLIKVEQINGEYSNVFKFKRGSFREGKVQYWDNEIESFVTITEFSDVIEEITNWIDFMTL